MQYVTEACHSVTLMSLPTPSQDSKKAPNVTFSLGVQTLRESQIWQLQNWSCL